jgi:hypothetical protein
VSGELVVVVDDNLTNLKLRRIVLAGEGSRSGRRRTPRRRSRFRRTFHPRLILMSCS